MRPEIHDDHGEDLKKLPRINLGDAEFEITVDFFDRPAQLPMAQAIKRTFETWLRDIGIKEPEARTVAGRFDSFWAAALHDEWRRHSDAYQPVLVALKSPFAKAAQMGRDWARYRRWLIGQVDQPVFGAPFSLRQIYVPLRAWYPEDDPEAPKSAASRYLDEGKAEKHKIVVGLRQRALTWWQTANTQSDAILLVSGGPGSGKSSFAKMFAAMLAKKEPRARILFLPLQRMYLRERTLTDAIGDILTSSDRSSWEHFRDNPVSAKDFPETDRRTLLIFDGLDELTKPGDKADEQTRAFIDDLRHTLDRWNQGKTRVLALLTGRTPTIQAHADNLKVAEQHRLNVLRLHLTDDERRQYYDTQNYLACDYRQIWWRIYHRLTCGTKEGLPEALDQDRFQDLTAEPLLDYLVAASGFRGSESGNRNELYASLFEDVAKRRHAQEAAERQKSGSSAAPASYHEYKDDFDQIMEAFATAAWRGDGRTAHLKDVLDACSQAVKTKLSEFLEVKGGHHRLIATFYMQMDRSGRDDAFEFTHKNFAEYLTARRLIREIRNIHRRMHDHDDLDDQRFGLVKWFRLCAPQQITIGIVEFLRDEIKCQKVHFEGEQVIDQWIEILTKLFNLNISEGMPALEGAVSYRQAEHLAVNAEEALLAAVNACARALGTIWSPAWIDRNGAADLIARLRMSKKGFRSTLYQQLISNMSCREQVIISQDMREFDLSFSDFSFSYLSNSNLSGSNLFRTNLMYAELTDAIVSNCNLAESNIEGAHLYNTDFSYSTLSRANLRAAKPNNLNISNSILSGTLGFEGFSTAELLVDSEAAMPIGLSESYNRDLRARFVVAKNDLPDAEGPTIWCVSYAWNDKTSLGQEREKVVDQLCEYAKNNKFDILRDKVELRLGDRISPFMRKIGKSDRIFVILSDKYLKSTSCMFELSEIWRNSRQEDDEFLSKIRVYTLDCANIWSLNGRLNYALYWKKELDGISRILKEADNDMTILGNEGYRDYLRMQQFASSVADLLSKIVDTLQPRNFDELVFDF